jgi:hypothetical protein
MTVREMEEDVKARDHFVRLYHAEVVLDRAAKHLMQQRGLSDEYLRIDEAHEIVTGMLRIVRMERDQSLVAMKGGA